ncbi:hypothetical protein RB195_015877 [Necator americanus]|uniref:Uncharacterized protein n=1 Tax=Necator americanus TaxID=51031 RepID=A0ABR1E7R2_NECAM
MRDRPVISIENYTIYCGDVDENKDAFYDEINVLMSKIPSQQVVIVGIDANAKTGLEQQSDVPGKWTLQRNTPGTNAAEEVCLCIYGDKIHVQFFLDAASGKAVGEATPPTWRDHFKTLLNRQAPSAPELEPVHRPTYAINEEPATESEILVCIQKMEMEHLVESTGLEQKC